MFKKILIANRGEIACRIIRTAKKLGIECVAIYSTADKNALHVRLADSAFCVGPAPSSQSYLNQELIMQIALAQGVEAIHPGYGFLSENAEFSAHCVKNNIVFIGPPASAIEAMGSKSAAKNLMEHAKVPLVPGYHGEDQTEVTLTMAADTIGYPVLIKAASGGGGKGMRVVHSATELTEAIHSAKREAKSSFGDDKLLIEKYLLTPRHVEVQIFADTHGNVVHLFERDCSTQRRYQKIIEEAPAPGMTDALRNKMTAAAIAAAKTIGYVGAGTIEFLLDGDQFYFMEMNTRLQVEHPVTEMITGLDLVEWQFRVAEGEPLPLKQNEIHCHGHAFEARIYAEDPFNNFLPSIGKLVYLKTPPISEHIPKGFQTEARRTRRGAAEHTNQYVSSESSVQQSLRLKGDGYIRVDTGILEGDSISQYYDPMIAKLIVWDADRNKALTQLAQALANYHIIGVTTNIDYLLKIIHITDFQRAIVSTNFIPQHQAELAPNEKEATTAVILAGLFILEQQKQLAKTSQDIYSPWKAYPAWQMNLSTHSSLSFIDQQHEFKLEIIPATVGYTFILNQQHFYVLATLDGNALDATIDGSVINANILQYQNELSIFTPTSQHRLKLKQALTSSHDSANDAKHLVAPMPGTIIAIHVEPGQSIKQGDALLIIEAMKMEHTIRAANDGIIEAVHFKVGDSVSEGVELLTLEKI